MKLSQDGWLAIGILLALVLVTSAAVIQQNQEVEIPYLSTSSAPDGVLALKLWLDILGYNAAETPAAFQPDESIHTIFILQPIEMISANDWKIIDKWVEQGGVLVLAGDNALTGMAMGHFEFSAAYLRETAAEIIPVAPVLNSPSLVSKVPVKTDFGISTTRTDFTPLMSAYDTPVIVSFEQGKGRVILSATPNIFSNLALKDDATAALVLNIIALTGKKGPVWFDEWHHGFQAETIVGPWQWLQNTPGGHAILFVVGTLFIALVLQGRAFGRPIPLVHEIRRRGPLEHVTAIANLNRKAGHSSEVLKQYHQRLKRHLGQRYRLDPTLGDEEYVNLLSQYNPSIDKLRLANLLKSLSQKNVSETELLKLASEVARLMED
jgi:Domain of unknown function (DUF4350)